MTPSLSGKTCLVTGGASGLGKAIATKFLTAGANVIICDINQDRLTQVSGELHGSGKTLKTIQADITSSAGVQSIFDTIAAEFGALNILVNNAGVMDRFDPVGDLDENIWETVLAVNLTAPFLLSKYAVRSMLGLERPDGCIVNVVSTAGKAGFAAGAAYTASKHGLVGLTKNTASFYGPKGIRCNALMVGGMMTNITDAFMAGVNEEGKDRVTDLMAMLNLPLCDVNLVADVCLSIVDGAGSRLINGACVPVDYGAMGVLG